MGSSQLPIAGFGGSGGGGGGDGPTATAGVGEADAGAGTTSGLSDPEESCPCGRDPMRGLKGSRRLGDGDNGSGPMAILELLAISFKKTV